MAGNFRGTKFSMITSFQLFANKFSRYIQAVSPLYYLKTISRFLFSRIGQNPRKPRNFCPSKISSYTVYDNYQEVVITQWYCSYHIVLSFDVWLHCDRMATDCIAGY